MKSLIAVFVLAISAVIALGCAAAGAESGTNGQTPLKSGGTAVNDTFGNRIPQEILESFVEVPGGILEKGRAGFGYYDSAEATEVFVNRVGESTAIGDTSTYGEKISVSGFSIMNSEVTVQMFVDFLNAISGKSESSNSGDNDFGVTFSDELTIYKPVMQQVQSCGIGRKVGDDVINDPITVYAGFFVIREKTSKDSYINPFQTPQRTKVRSNTQGQISSTFFVKNDRGDFPMNFVSLTDAKEFCQWLGPNYRLPTEEEWSLAAKGGGNVNFATSTGNITVGTTYNEEPIYLANIQGEFSETPSTKKVKQYAPNSYGIHDMTGNVAELCYYRAEDELVGVSQEIGRPIAGGSFATRSYAFSSTWRLPTGSEGVWASDIGFRVVYDNNRALTVFEAIDPIP